MSEPSAHVIGSLEVASSDDASFQEDVDLPDEHVYLVHAELAHQDTDNLANDHAEYNENDNLLQDECQDLQDACQDRDHSDNDMQKLESLPAARQLLALNTSEFFAAGAVLLYGGTAISMGFVNKAVLSTYHFTESNVLLLLQQVVAILILRLMASFELVSVAPLSWAVAQQLLLVSFLYNANVAFALASLSSLNIPMYMALKRLTPSFVLIANYWRGKSRPSNRVAASVSTIVFGCLIAGYGDLSFDMRGYLYAFTSCFLQSAYLLCVEHTGVEQGIGSTDMLRYNALLSLVPLALLTHLTGEAASALSTLEKVQNDRGFWITFAAALGLGLLLNYALFLCTELNSAQTTTVVGALKGVVTTALGFVLLGGIGSTSVMNVSGILLNAFGGAWYSYVKFTEKHQAKVAATIARTQATSSLNV